LELDLLRVTRTVLGLIVGMLELLKRSVSRKGVVGPLFLVDEVISHGALHQLIPLLDIRFNL
jgi:hypothetical protein